MRPKYFSSTRWKAIWYCVKFGLMPWWMYPPGQRDHNRGWYFQHLWLNAQAFWKYVTMTEVPAQWDFEAEENNNPPRPK